MTGAELRSLRCDMGMTQPHFAEVVMKLALSSVKGMESGTMPVYPWVAGRAATLHAAHMLGVQLAQEAHPRPDRRGQNKAHT
jgi:hypothetical protein